nr:MAG TPA: hypothetical protein [Caudoviricetes sp.]
MCISRTIYIYKASTPSHLQYCSFQQVQRRNEQAHN